MPPTAVHTASMTTKTITTARIGARMSHLPQRLPGLRAPTHGGNARKVQGLLKKERLLASAPGRSGQGLTTPSARAARVRVNSGDLRASRVDRLSTTRLEL